jgi:hypothetical protein
LAEHLETFLQQARTAEHHLPFHVEKEMRAYLECGVLAYGFLRARCDGCGTSRAVAFSCKKRGFCTSCAGRRTMLDGVYVDGDEGPQFVPAPPLTDDDVQQIVQTSARRIIRLCTKRGLLDDTQADPLTDEEPVLAAITAASLPPESALASGYDECFGIRPRGYAPGLCALPPAVSLFRGSYSRESWPRHRDGRRRRPACL